MIKHITAAAILAMALAGTSGAARAQTADGQSARATAVGENARARPAGSVAIGRDLVMGHIAPWDATQKVSPVIHDDHSVRPSCVPDETFIERPCTATTAGTVTTVAIGSRSGVIKGRVSATIGSKPYW